MLQTGSLAQQRRAVADWANRFPAAVRAAIFVRWSVWAWVGWWFTYAFVNTAVVLMVVVPLKAAWPVVGLIAPTGWALFSAVWSAAWRAGGWGAVILAVLAGGCAWGAVWVRQQVDPRTADRVRAGLKVGLLVGCGLFTGWRVGPLVTGILLAGPLFGAALDLWLGRRFPLVRLLRAWAWWRREWPPQWSLAAAQSGKVQSLDQTVERNVTLSAKHRPILEAPWMWVWPDKFDVDSWSVEQRVGPPPGRTFKRLIEMLPTLSAAMPQIEDHDGSLQVLRYDRPDSDFASWAWLRVQFKRGDTDRVPVPWRKPEPVGAGFDG